MAVAASHTLRRVKKQLFPPLYLRGHRGGLYLGQYDTAQKGQSQREGEPVEPSFSHNSHLIATLRPPHPSAMGITPCSRANAARDFTQTGWSFRQGIRLNPAPPSAKKVCLPRIPISSRVSRQSTVNAGQITASLRTPDRANRTSWSCVDGSSHLSLPSLD